MRVHDVSANIVSEARHYLYRHQNIESLILGISGGADSALMAAIGNEVCDCIKKYAARSNIKLIGRLLSIDNTEDEKERARSIATNFCDSFKEEDLITIYHQMRIFLGLPSNPTNLATKIRLGNIKARLRMIYLYNLAHQTNGLVLSTDNLTEYNLGFWTLHGDVGDYGMVQNLWKTEIYQLLQHYININPHGYRSRGKYQALKACYDAVPTDGLGITESDFDQMGDVTTYEEVDILLQKYMKEGVEFWLRQNQPVPEVVLMHIRSEYKRKNPCNIPRETLLQPF